MCQNCNEITIPQGPTGATGPQGPTGATGSTGPAGSDGTDGENGYRILYSSMDDNGNTNTAGTQTLESYTVGIGELSSDGDEIEAEVICAIDLTGFGTLVVQVGSNASGISLTDNTTIRVNVKISRIDASNILRTTQYWVDNGSSTTSRILISAELFNSTISNPIYIKSVLGSNGADQVIVNKFTIYKNKI